jgi:guanine deaminase
MQPMKLAVQEAILGIQKADGGPFGATIMRGDIVIASAHNTVLKDRDPTCHAEMNVIRLAAASLGEPHLQGCVIYTTAEPCPMCLSAIYWARIERVIIGVDKSIAAKYGFDDSVFYEQILKPAGERKVSQEYGVLAHECEEVFVSWESQEGELY